jgi:D-3-phosphoglycerate dehydrogenase
VEIRGKTLGLIGAGRIGSEVARRARAFGLDLAAYDPYLTEERAEELGVRRESLEELLGRSDFVSLHVPLTEATRGMLGAEQLGLMKKGAFLVNAARGGVVDEWALARALQDGHLSGAAVDVFEAEPLGADSPLREAPNLVLTPHLGASTAEAQERVALEISRSVAAALLHGDLSRALNAPAIAGEELKRLRPLLGLGLRLGHLASVLAQGGMEVVEIRYGGTSAEGIEALAAHVLMGILGPIVGEDQVNFVNAGHLAQERGIGVSRHRMARRAHYTEFVEIIIVSEESRTRVAGALLGEHHARVVRIDDYHVDITPRGSLLVLRNRDVPGVIGKVGSLLGDAALNIAEYHQARGSDGGAALAAIAVDGLVSRDVLRSLCSLPEVVSARLVELD